MIENRRREMGHVVINADSYIQDGLVFQLDGIDYGGIDGHWIERKNGYDWYEHNGADLHTENDCMIFDGSSWFLCDDTISDYPDSTHSIEAVFSGYINQWNSIICIRSNNVALWTNVDSKFMGAKGSQKPAFNSSLIYGNNIKYINLFGNNLCVNGVDYTSTTSSTRAQYGKPTIGALEGSNASSYHAHNGEKYYAIRIYNRQLTEDEMAHNYEIDKIRFNF